MLPGDKLCAPCHRPVPSPAAVQWAAGRATLVVVGDVIDKGPQSVEVLELFMALEAQAAAAGGRMVVLWGNHEAEFLANPHNKKAGKRHGINRAWHARDIKPRAVADGTDPQGAWLRNLPAACLIGPWFFAHAGETDGYTPSALDATWQKALLHQGFGSQTFIGTHSLPEARRRFDKPHHHARRKAQAPGVHYIVFGHDPDAPGKKGPIAPGKTVHLSVSTAA